jgi:hypothetical protein
MPGKYITLNVERSLAIVQEHAGGIDTKTLRRKYQVAPFDWKILCAFVPSLRRRKKSEDGKNTALSGVKIPERYKHLVEKAKQDGQLEGHDISFSDDVEKEGDKECAHEDKREENVIEQKSDILINP